MTARRTESARGPLERLAAYETSQTVDTEERQRRGDNEKPLERVSAERRPIWTVEPEVRKKGEENIGAANEAHHTENDASNRGIDGEKEIDETGEEEEDGDVKQGRHCLDGLRETERLRALEGVLPRASTLVQRGLGLGLLEVPPSPLLH